MFNSNEHSDACQKILKLYQHGERAQAAAMAATLMPKFRETSDDLRVLFYIGSQVDADAFEENLPHFTHWRDDPPPRFAYRCTAFLYAVQNSIPPRLRPEKQFMITRFLEVTGFDPATQSTTVDS